jgi:hypothetical protein
MSLHIINPGRRSRLGKTRTEQDKNLRKEWGLGGFASPHDRDKMTYLEKHSGANFSLPVKMIDGVKSKRDKVDKEMKEKRHDAMNAIMDKKEGRCVAKNCKRNKRG